MNSQSNKVEGTVIGYAVRANSPQDRKIGKWGTQHKDGYLGGGLTVWAGGYLQTVECPTKYEVPIKNNGDVRLHDADRILEELKHLFPLGSKVVLKVAETRSYGRNKPQEPIMPFFILESTKGFAILPENTRPYKQPQQKKSTTPAVEEPKIEPISTDAEMPQAPTTSNE